MDDASRTVIPMGVEMETPSEDEFLFHWKVEPLISEPSDGLFVYWLGEDRVLRFSFNLLDHSIEIWKKPHAQVTLEGITRCYFDEHGVLRVEGDLGNYSVQATVCRLPSPAFEVIVLRVR